VTPLSHFKCISVAGRLLHRSASRTKCCRRYASVTFIRWRSKPQRELQYLPVSPDRTEGVVDLVKSDKPDWSPISIAFRMIVCISIQSSFRN